MENVPSSYYSYTLNLQNKTYLKLKDKSQVTWEVKSIRITGTLKARMA
jgi:hypothetical protein